jgi:hypothetical protein
VPRIAHPKKGDRAVDSSAHRHGDATVVRRRPDRGAERIMERVRGQAPAGNRCGLEQRSTLDLPDEIGHAGALPRRVLDPLPGHSETHPGQISVLGGVSYELTVGGHEKKRCPTPPMMLRA